MSPSRQRREAAKRLALEFQSKYRALVEAQGQDEIQNAAIMLGGAFNANIEFVINVLRDYGGLEAKWDQAMTKSLLPMIPANEDAAALADRLKRESKLN